MNETQEAEVHSTLAKAREIEERTRSAGRWFPTLLWVLGVISIVNIVVVEALYPEGRARMLASAVMALVAGLALWWGESHAAYPHGARRRLTIAFAIWFVAYVWVLGPLVRWRAGNALGWWSLAALVFATPFFVSAWLEGRRR